MIFLALTLIIFTFIPHVRMIYTPYDITVSEYFTYRAIHCSGVVISVNLGKYEVRD